MAYGRRDPLLCEEGEAARLTTYNLSVRDARNCTYVIRALVYDTWPQGLAAKNDSTASVGHKRGPPSRLHARMNDVSQTRRPE